MVTVDDRAGSIDLAVPLRSRGLPVKVERMEYGDVAFVGNGPEGCPVLVGIEHKQVSDILKCIVDGRFAGHQLPGLVAAYNHVWLVIEGGVRQDYRNGMLQVPGGKGGWYPAEIGRRRFMGKELDNFLTTVEMKAGVHVVRTLSQTESADKISNLYKWWTAKEWEEHRSHLAFDEAAEASRRATLVPPNVVRRIAKELPGIGWEKSINVAAHFGSVVAMVAADKEDWMKIPGIGKGLAAKIVEAIEKQWR